jgi:uncharacterized membrane protein
MSKKDDINGSCLGVIGFVTLCVGIVVGVQAGVEAAIGIMVFLGMALTIAGFYFKVLR